MLEKHSTTLFLTHSSFRKTYGRPFLSALILSNECHPSHTNPYQLSILVSLSYLNITQIFAKYFIWQCMPPGLQNHKEKMPLACGDELS